MTPPAPNTFAWITGARPGTGVARVGEALMAGLAGDSGFRRVAFNPGSGWLEEAQAGSRPRLLARGVTRLGKTAFVLSAARGLPEYGAAFVDSQNLAFLAPPRSCLFLHDLFYRTHANSVLESIQGRILYRGLRRYEAVLCNSEYTRDEALRLGAADAEKLTVVPLGFDREVFRSQEVDKARWRAAVGLPEGAQVIAHVSSGEPRKNLPGLLRAFARLARQRECLYLVKAGQDLRQKNYPTALELAKELGIGDRVKILGGLDDAAMAQLYGAADVFAFPSFAEGFGLPVLEAQACGCPGVVSNRTALPEVAGPLCRQVDPGDIGALAEALAAQLDDTGLRGRKAGENAAFLSRFSWEPGRRFLEDFFRRSR